MFHRQTDSNKQDDKGRRQGQSNEKTLMGFGECRAVLTPNRKEKRQNGPRFKDDGEPMFTLTKQDIHGVMICEK